jgi:RNA polymerase-binding protein DksA
MAKAKKKAKAKAKPKVKAKPKAKPKPKVKAKPKAKPKPKVKPKVKAKAAKKVVAKKPKAKVVAAPKKVVAKAAKMPAPKPVQEKVAPAKVASGLLKAKLPLAKTAPIVVKKPPVEVSKPPAPPPVSPVPRREQMEIREKLTNLLAQLQNNIQGGVKAAGERDLAHIVDTSDMASDSAEGDLAFRIAESEGVAATEVQKAIEKIDTGSYGICERCNKSIGMERIHALPFATHCIKCQELTEIRKKDDDEEELDDLADAIDEAQEEA